MEFRWVGALYIGTFILGFALISDSKDPKGFQDLVCDTPSDCSIGVENCQLVRCDCPPSNTSYCSETDTCRPVCILNQLRTNSCCDFIPRPFHTSNILHFLHIERYTDVITENLNNIFVKIMVWSRAEASPSNNFKLIRTNLINADNGSDPAIPTTLSISDAVPPSTVSDAVATLNTIDVIPVQDSNLANGLADLTQTDPECKKDLSCGEGLTTDCECHQCRIYATPPVESGVKNFSSTPDGWFTLEIGNHYANSTSTSSKLSALHDPSTVNVWDEGTFGGWAPSVTDTDMWVAFHGLKANICGIAIQGMAGSTYRTLEKFNVTSGSTGGDPLVDENGDPIIFESGVVLHSISTHYFPTPIDQDCLQINVMEPSDPLRVGFRPGLIACQEETPYCQNANVCSLVKRVVDKFEQAFSGQLNEITPSNDSSNLKDEISQDPAGTAVFVFDIVSSVIKQNTEELPANFSAKVKVANVDISFEGREPSLLKNEGFSLEVDSFSGDNSGTDGAGGADGAGDGGSEDDVAPKIEISVPPDAFGGLDPDIPVVFVVAVTQPNISAPPQKVDVEPSHDGGAEEEKTPVYKLASPVIMMNTFVDGAPTQLNSFTYSVNYRNTTGNYEPRCAFFNEQDVPLWNETVQWGFEGCTIKDNRTQLKADCHCNHTTSYAVLLSLGESKLTGDLIKWSSIITYVGCGISIAALLAALTIYFVLRSSISAARYAIHSNLMVALLLSTSLFVSGLIYTTNDALCVITKYLLQYLFTATFCWMLSEGLHLYRQIITVFESEKKQTWIYFAVGWAVPIILVLVALVSNQMMNTHLPVTFEENGKTTRLCFFSYIDNTIWYVFAPVLLIVVINLCILVRVTFVVVKAVKIQAEKDSSEKITQVKAGVRSSLLLMPLLGSAHILAFVTTVHGSFELVYNAVNSLQGFFIALFYCGMNTEVRNAISQYIRRSKDASTIQGSTTGLRVNSETSKSKGFFGKKNKVQPATQFTFTEGSSRVSDDLAPCQS